MKLLLDTHVLLWWLDNPTLLSKKARNAIEDGKNLVYISAAVLWEIMIKQSLGKLKTPENIESALTANSFNQLSITIAHTLALKKLAVHHRDPFDRMLIAQALCEGFTIVSRDVNIQKYAVSHLFA